MERPIKSPATCRSISNFAINGIDELVAAQRRDCHERVWLVALLALSAIPSISALVRSFSSSFVVQDDARQFLFWMSKWDDGTLFHGDLLADYWQSVSPWLFVMFYRGLDAVGIPPLIAAKLVPPVLIITTAYFAFRLSQSLINNSMVAFVAALSVLIVISHEDSVFSATPRGFALPLFLVVLDSVVRRRAILATIAQFLAAGIYPHVALVSLGIAALTTIRWEPRPRLDVSARSLVSLGLMAAATAGGLLPFLFESGRYGPVADIAQAMTMPAFQHAGRTPIAAADGSINALCSNLIGLEPKLLPCKGFADPRLLLNIIYLAAPPALLMWRRLRLAKSDSQGPIGVEIYLYGLAVALACFAIAEQVPFKFYWPGRFLLRPMTVLLPIEYGQIVGLGLLALLDSRALAAAHRPAKASLACAIATLMTIAIVSLVTISPRNRRPLDTGLIQSIAALPPDTVVAGFVSDMDFVPVLAKRGALFTYEHSIPLHLGYYRQIEARMHDMVELEFTANSATLAADLVKWSVGVYVISKDRLANPNHMTGFEAFVPDDFTRENAARKGAVTALSRAAAACTIKEFTQTIMLDAACLVSKPWS